MGAWLYRRVTPPASPGVRPVVRSWLDVAPAERLHGGAVHPAGVPTPAGARTAFTWTPDGKALVFAGVTGDSRHLYLRPLDSTRALAIPGTDGAMVPVVSADGRSVAFWSHGAIRKVALAGGPTDVLASGVTYPPDGMAWAADGSLFYDQDGLEGRGGRRRSRRSRA